jgi:hypothetical protein
VKRPDNAIAWSHEISPREKVKERCSCPGVRIGRKHGAISVTLMTPLVRMGSATDRAQVFQRKTALEPLFEEAVFPIPCAYYAPGNSSLCDGCQ